MYEKAIENLKETGSNRKLDRLLIQSMSEIKLNKKSMVQYVVSITLAAIAAYVIVYKSDTVELFTNAVDVINNTSLALIAIVFGTYSIFQALMTDTVIWALLLSEKNLLNVSNKSFLHLIILFLIEIMMNIVLLIIMPAIPNEFCILDNLVRANSVAFILMLIYFGFCFLLFYEIKNFAVNLYQMFNVYNIYKGIELVKKNIGEQEEKEEEG